MLDGDNSQAKANNKLLGKPVRLRFEQVFDDGAAVTESQATWKKLGDFIEKKFRDGTFKPETRRAGLFSTHAKCKTWATLVKSIKEEPEDKAPRGCEYIGF